MSEDQQVGETLTEENLDTLPILAVVALASDGNLFVKTPMAKDDPDLTVLHCTNAIQALAEYASMTQLAKRQGRGPEVMRPNPPGVLRP